jgi:hypothetical protein
MVVFRNRNVTTAEVMEELRHLGQTRHGARIWDLGFQAREIEAGAYLHRRGNMPKRLPTSPFTPVWTRRR